MPAIAPELLQLSLPATAAHVGTLRRAAQAFAADAGADAPSDVAIAVSEAVTNAVLHAYVGAAPGLVHLEAGAEGGELLVVVRDDGRGLLPRPDSPGLGLGLPTMAQLAGALQISDDTGGVVVRMSFPLATAAAA